MSFLTPPWYCFFTLVSNNEAAFVSIYCVFSVLRLEEV